MAGIAGTTSKNTRAVEAMLSRLKHRGPVRTWIEEGDIATMGCCLLSSEAEAHARVYARNTESSAILDGHLFQGEELLTDAAEALLRGYQQSKLELPRELDGDFAFAIASGSDVMLVRDHIGSHPLYYGYHNGDLYFSSEAKGLLDVVTEVTEFTPGQVFTLKGGFRPYPKPSDPVPSFETPEQAASILVGLLETAVRRCMSDGAVDGMLLSGGLDSSVIALLATKLHPGLDTFVVGMADQDDMPRAREMARLTGSNHHEKLLNVDDLARVLPSAIYHLESFEDSCVHGAVAHYLAAEFAAANGATCMLCGEGSDEFLGGYHELKQASSRTQVDEVTDYLISNAYHTALQRLDRAFNAHSIEYRPPFLDRYVTNFCRSIPHEWKQFGPNKIEKWILRQAFAARLPESIASRVKSPFASGAGIDRVTKEIVEQRLSQEELERNPKADSGLRFNSLAELYYYRIFKDMFPDPSYSRLVTRWDPFLRC
jgi:asparagine synthase (glutamine-hydrolysing)